MIFFGFVPAKPGIGRLLLSFQIVLLCQCLEELLWGWRFVPMRLSFQKLNGSHPVPPKPIGNGPSCVNLITSLFHCFRSLPLLFTRLFVPSRHTSANASFPGNSTRTFSTGWSVFTHTTCHNKRPSLLASLFNEARARL